MIKFEGVCYTYPYQDAPALKDISFSAAPGEAVLCTGVSGSGKSTLIRLINGLAPHFHRGRLQGRVTVGGLNTAASSVRELSGRVGTLFQNPEHQFFALRVRDELRFALECRGRDPETIRRVTEREAERFGLASSMDAMIFDLSQGEKQKVAMAGILCDAPRAIILDEPSANLDPRATEALCRTLARLKARGITLFIADHRLYWLADLVDRVMVLDQGCIACQGPFDMFSDKALLSRYGLRDSRVSRPVLKAAGTLGHGSVNGDTGGQVEVENLFFAHRHQPLLFKDLSFSLSRGRVIALTGPNGAGKTTLARIMTGLLPFKQGRIRVNGTALAPRDLLRKSCIVLQNTDHQLHMKTVRQELEVSARKRRCSDRAVERALEQFGLAPFEHRHPQSLSGGQKQRLVIACALVKSPDILILDEPTSGLDGINMRIMAGAVSDLARSGACVLVITHDLELMGRACAGELALPMAT